jgi:hypothetical protein
LHDFELVAAADPDSKLHWLHMILGTCKQDIQGIYHGLRAGHLQDYLDEFCYRFNRRHIPELTFQKIIDTAFLTKPVRYYSKAVLVG